MITKSKIFNISALIVVLSMIATAVSAQPNPTPARKALSDIITRASVSQPEPPEPELVLTAPYVSDPVAPANTDGLPLASAGDVSMIEPREVLKHLPRSKPGQVAHARDYDPVVQTTPGRTNMPLPSGNWEGISSMGPIPPDTDGQVGPDHYVQIVNSPDGSQVRVWDKVGTELYDFDMGSLWPITDTCYIDAYGDPVVLYDQMADRWLLTQFALPDPPYYECIAVSKTGVPTNNPNDWWLYSFLVHDTKMNDYPKFGIWPDGYYMSVNQFAPGWAGAGAYVFDRDAMLNGDPATFQYFDLWDINPNYGGMLPSNLMGDTLPPTGAPNYFMSVDMDWAGSDDIMHVFEFHTDWTNPLSSTFSLVSDLVVAPFDWEICASGYCIDQPDDATPLDSLSDRLMMHLWYRNFGDYESLVVNHTVDAGSGRAGVRWYELRGGAVDTTLADVTIYQQGTFAPDDTLHRWMGSIAMDSAGNMALGYSVSSASTYPSIRYGGRQAGDPLGTLPEAEVEIIAGSGVQTHPAARWGDYSAMSVDPVDDCTFWYTQEYVETTGERSWQTRVASFQYPSCSPDPKGTLTGVVSDSVTLAPIAEVAIQATASLTRGYQTASGTDGAYSMLLLADTYTVTASRYGYQPATVGPVDVLSGTTTVQDITLTPATMYTVEGVVTDDTTGWPLYAHITVSGDPLDPPAPYNDFWTDPVTGYYSLTLAEGITYTFDVEAWSVGYGTAGREVGPLTMDVTEDFELAANLATCIAPGYQLNLQSGVFERFENGGVAPAGWTVVDNASTGEVWAFDNPGGRDNVTGGNGDFAIVDSDYYGASGHQDTELRTPSMDFTSVPSVTLAFDTDYWSYTGSDVADVDVSANGGISWTTVFSRSGASDRGPLHEVVDISALAGGESDVLARFHYYDAFYEWWWQVDNVLVGVATCDPLSGGLVVGNVYDGNTGDGVDGAEIANDSGDLAISEATPDDPAVDDGFYVLFSPDGSHTFTATMPFYTTGVEMATVPLSDTVRRDFSLAAPMMNVTPSSLSSTQPLDSQVIQALTISNDGTDDLHWEIPTISDSVADGSFEAGSPNPFWDEGGDIASPVCSAGLCGSDLALTGDWYLWFGGWGVTNTSAVTQTVVIPEGVATLSFWLWIQPDQGILDVLLDGTPVASFTEADAPAYTDYAEVVVDVSAYADDGTHDLAIVGTEISTGGMNFFVDDVALIVTSVPDWLGVSPVSGTLAAGISTTVDITFDSSVVMPGEYTTQLIVDHDTPYDVPDVPATMTVVLRPTWDKTVYVNGELVTSFPATAVPSDTVEIVDVVSLTTTENITFTLTEEWTESLELVDYSVYALPDGTVIVPGFGTAIPAPGMLVVSVTNAPGDWEYVITKTFTVLDVGGGTDFITETLEVEDTYPPFDPIVLQFVSERIIYLPLIMRNW